MTGRMGRFLDRDRLGPHPAQPPDDEVSPHFDMPRGPSASVSGLIQRPTPLPELNLAEWRQETVFPLQRDGLPG